MIENKVVLKQLQNAKCYKCGGSLEHAKIVPITSSQIGWVGHAVCPACKAESMVTITQTGTTGIMPVQSDLKGIEYKKFVGTDKISSDVKKIVPAAYHGQVESLFVAVGVQRWGIFDPSKNIVKLPHEAELTDADLLDFAAIQTFLQGGSVFVVEPDQVPDEAQLAAVFRY